MLRVPTLHPAAPNLQRLWWALLFLTPLAFNPLSRWEFEPDKAALTVALTAALLGTALRRGALTVNRAAPVELALVAVLGWRWLATAHSILPAWSLWGDPAWRTGLWLALAMTVLFILARRTLVHPEQRWRAVDALLAGSALVSAYGILQYGGLDPLNDAAWVRVPSTLAHPNLLAAYLAMALPLTVARLGLLRAGPPAKANAWRRLALAGLLAMQLLCLVFTYSRAGWLAVMAGLGVMLGLRWAAAGKRAAAAALVGGALLTGMALLALSQLPPLPGDAPHALQTLTSMLRWQGATGQIRLLGWRASLEALRERPWLGYGAGTFSTVLPWHLPPELAPFGGAGALGGRPHNVALEMALECGVPGLVGFIAILAALLGLPVSRLLKGAVPLREARLLAACVGAMTANLVTYGLSFESVPSGVLFWTLAGMAQAIVAPARGHPHPKRPVLGTLIAAGGVGLALWMAAPDVMATAGERLTLEGEYAPAAVWLERAIALAPTPEIFMGIEANTWVQWGLEARDATLFERGDALHALRVGRQSFVVLYWRQWGDALRRWNSGNPSPELPRRAEEAYSAALALSPRDPDLWLDRGLARLESADLESALSMALSDFDAAQALLHGYTRYYGSMAIYALRRGDAAAAGVWQAMAAEAQRDWDAWVWRR